ncbi:MAG: sugar phosphate isomerase/epimerase family protein [Lentisphaeria bacterium]|jgi:sugar phosphate isomerase/epimerase
MHTAPLTCLFDFEHTNDKTRPYVMQEFAVNGVTNLVLTDTLISEIMKNPNFARKLRDDLNNTGTRFVDAHAPFGPNEDLNVPIPELRPIMLERLKLALRITADFGVDSIAVHVGNTPECFAAYSLDDLHRAIIQSLEELLPLAERLGVTIAIENIWFPTSTPEKLLDLIAHFRSEHLGICFDSGHANLMALERHFEVSAPINGWKRFGPVPYDDKILEKLLPEITTCHLHDNDGQNDQHLLPGRGNIDWQHCMTLLKQAPRLKCYQSEVIPVRTNASIADVCRTFLAMV